MDKLAAGGEVPLFTGRQARCGGDRRRSEAGGGQYPGLQIAGTHDGYFQERTARWQRPSRRSGADVVFVCLGAPKQEKWMAKIRRRPQAPGCCAAWGAVWTYSPDVVERAPEILDRPRAGVVLPPVQGAPPHRPDDEAAAVFNPCQAGEETTDERKTDCIRGHGRLRQGHPGKAPVRDPGPAGHRISGDRLSPVWQPLCRTGEPLPRTEPWATGPGT